MSVLLLLFTASVMGQKKGSVLHVNKSDSAHHVVRNSVGMLIVYKGVFQQDNTVFSSDSAYLYDKDNMLDAFGHVIISQGDTLHVFGDKLNYQGNTKIAILTDNVRLIDRDAVLTTNYFTYNTGTKYGTYTGGGKLVNKDNTLVSQNGYYLASTRDAYFRYNVVLNTADAIIKNDTLRYNSGTRIAYFYGPTNIYGKKDKDTLYTENGTYNTQTEQAFFGKNNLYRQNTKTLKGDSLFYDRLAGYGKAVKHVTFTDTEQKIILHGDLGETFKKGDRTLVTQHAYVVFVTEEKDTTKKSKADTLAAKPKTAIVKKDILSPPPNTMPLGDPSQVKAAKDMADQALSGIPKVKKDTALAAAKAAIKKAALLPPNNSMPLADTNKLKVAGKGLINKDVPAVIKDDTLLKMRKDTSHIKRDSIFMTADTIETQIVTYKEVRTVREARFLAGIRDTSVKVIPSIVYTKPVKYIENLFVPIPPDTTVFHRDYFDKRPSLKDTLQHKAIAPTVKEPSKEMLKVALKDAPKAAPPKKPAKPLAVKINPIDSVNIGQDVKLADTARVRILVASHHAKIFKSDLQAKADSIFFSYSDSVARMYYKPMIWAQGSQISADTINLQMKKKQLDNMELYPSSFMVNIEKGDTTHFNQVGGKKMRAFFKNNKLDKMFVLGNAETIYFDRDSGKVIQMHRTISGKIRVRFKSNEPLDIFWFVKPEAKVLPVGKLKEDDKILRGFIWKPEDRPVSKESIINPKPVKPPVKKSAGKPDAKKPPAGTGPRTGTKTNAPDTKAEAGPEEVLPARPKAATDTLKGRPDTLKRFKLRPDTTIKTKPHEPAKQ